VVTIRSAIDTEVYCPRRSRRLKGEFGLPDDVVAVGMVAQFIPRKGHAHLLTAAPVVIAAVPNVRFILFGRGPEEGAVRKQIAADGLTGHVVVAGFRDDLDRLLPDLDVMVHPVEREGLGVALLQAAACGVPVVASAVGGVPEAVRDGESGLLVPAGDAGALARALIDLLADAERRRSMGRRSREMALREFAISVMVERHLDLYDALLADAAHPALYRGHA
jgi:glycosyltransferase involved in cell wall biosynthesis